MPAAEPKTTPPPQPTPTQPSMPAPEPKTTPPSQPTPTKPSIPAPEPKAPLPPQTTPPAETKEWAADGIISDGEYLGEMKYGNYELFWTTVEQHVYIALKVKTTGWVSLGIKPTSRMKDADMVFGFVKNGNVTVTDHFSTGNFGPHSPDTELGGTEDILEFGGSEEEGYTIIEFKRALTTGDKYDNELSKAETNSIIWAYGSTDNPAQKHAARGDGEIRL